MSARSHYLNTYTPTFSRALHSYVNNGFFARDLDADDYAFIEGIRDGKCNIGADRLSSGSRFYPPSNYDQQGSMRYIEERSRKADRSHSTYFDPEMLEYWRHRWAFEAIGDAERRAFYAQQQEERKAERARWAQERETMRGELAREELAWQKEQEAKAQEREKRLLDTMQADREWEEAGADAAEKQRLQEAASAILKENKEAKQKAKWAKFWDDARAQEWVKEAKAKQARLNADADLERLKDRVRRSRLREKRKREAEEAQRLASAEARQTAWVKEQEEAKRRKAEREAIERGEYEKRRAEWAEAMRQADPPPPLSPRELTKNKLCDLIVNAWPKRYSMHSLMLALNLKDELLVHQLGKELVMEGRLQLLPEAYGARPSAYTVRR